VFEVTVEDKRWDWKGGADYFVNDDTMIYASAGSGYRLSGFVVRPWQAGQEGSIPGDALISYEIGAKSEFFNRRLRVNVAAFQMDFTSRSASYGGQEGQWNNTMTGLAPGNMTVVAGGPQNTPYSSAFTTCRPYVASDGPQNLNTTPDKGVGVSCLFRSYNYGVAGQIRGFEGEVQAEPVDGLLINGSFGYSKWTSEGTARQTVIPNWTASGGIQYEIEARGLGGTITPRLDWFFNSKIYYAADFPDYSQGNRSVFNGRLTYRNDDHQFDIALGATNLFNKFYWVNQFPRATFGGSVNAGQPAAPREVYLNLKKYF
jgi:iron complex outermembrane receptor protein